MSADTSQNNKNSSVNEVTDKQQVIAKLRDGANILITTSRNPNVDQLASAIGLSLMLGKANKHAITLVSGKVPASINFLSPEKYFKKDVDNLRDFIISLDKNKADKLRYKIDGDVAKIYITPLEKSLTKDDFTFSQGSLNVDVVIALGVKDKKDIDEAISSHGRILHNATVLSINAGEKRGEIGSINWSEPKASSISEIMVSLSEALQPGILDDQISNALLTGIVSATNQFTSDNTSPKVMTMAAQLMAAGANQQVIVSELNSSEAISTIKPVSKSSKKPKAQAKKSDNIPKTSKKDIQQKGSEPPAEKPQPQPESTKASSDKIAPTTRFSVEDDLKDENDRVSASSASGFRDEKPFIHRAPGSESIDSLQKIRSQSYSRPQVSPKMPVSHNIAKPGQPMPINTRGGIANPSAPSAPSPIQQPRASSLPPAPVNQTPAPAQQNTQLPPAPVNPNPAPAQQNVQLPPAPMPQPPTPATPRVQPAPQPTSVKPLSALSPQAYPTPTPPVVNSTAPQPTTAKPLNALSPQTAPAPVNPPQTTPPNAYPVAQNNPAPTGSNNESAQNSSNQEDRVKEARGHIDNVLSNMN